MLRSLLLVGAGAASGWFAHRALGDRAHPATWAAPYLPHTGPIISGETVEPPSHGAARPQTTTTQKDTPA